MEAAFPPPLPLIKKIMSSPTVYYNIECFRDIIGLSRIDCECFDPNMGYDESYSGLYLDEAEGLSLRMIDAVKDCENDDNLWLLMDTARGNAIRRVIADTTNKLLEKYKQARPNFNGNIGRFDYKTSRALNKIYAGQRWLTANVVGGYAHITNISTFFSAVGTVDVLIYNNLNELIETVTLQTANGRQDNAVDILLPVWNENTTELQYIFIYTYNPANQPKNNDVGCSSCGVNYTFDCRNPYWKSTSNKLKGWSKWLMAGNIETDTLDFSDLSCTTSNFTNGLSFGVHFYCDMGKTFCFDEPDQFSETFMSLAFAIRHKAAELLAIQILTSPNVSRYTMVAGEALNAIVGHHRAEYDKLVDYLVKTVDIKNTDCLVCKDHIRMGVGVL